MRCNIGLGPSETLHDDESTVHCGFFSSFIFFLYCAVDFCCYGFGLYVIQNGGANLMVISSAVALPVQQLVLCLSLLGVYKETFFWGDTVAFVLVLVGFLVHQVLSPDGAFRGRSTKDNGGNEKSSAYSDAGEFSTDA